MKNRIYDNGIYREMTAEEMKNNADLPQVKAEVTAEERLAALEAAVIELAGVILNG